MYGRVDAFAADIGSENDVPVRAARFQMTATDDVVIELQGDHLRWYLGTTLLACDSSSTDGLPSEVFAVLTGSAALTVIRASNPFNTYVAATRIDLSLDEDDLDCP